MVASSLVVEQLSEVEERQTCDLAGRLFFCNRYGGARAFRVNICNFVFPVEVIRVVAVTLHIGFRIMELASSKRPRRRRWLMVNRV